MAAPSLISHRNTTAKAAVIFVHGFGGSPEATWQKFPEFLIANPRLNGWDIFSLGYPSNFWLDLVGIWKADPPVDSLADGLRTAVTLAPLDHYRSLALIAHSMGGLVVQRALVEDDEFAKRVGHVYLFGTPSLGLIKALFFRFWKQQLNHMARGESFITELRDRWTKKFGSKYKFDLLVVAGDQDQFVPRQSSVEPFPMEYRRVIRGDHLSIVKPQSSDSPAVQLVMRGLGDNDMPTDPAEASIEKQNFYTTIEKLSDHAGELDETGLVQLALAYEGVGESDRAFEILSANAHKYLDSIGVLAGRLKRRWLFEQRQADATEARKLYAQGFEKSLAEHRPDQAYYHAINVGFMDFAISRERSAAVPYAEKALSYCAQAARTKWQLATEGEAKLILGRTDDAFKAYREAVFTRPAPRELTSMYQQAIQVAGLIGDTDLAQRLEEIFRGGN